MHLIYILLSVCVGVVKGHQDLTNGTLIVKQVFLNDLIELECRLNEESNESLPMNMTGNKTDSFAIFVFKKEDILIQLNRPILQLKMQNLTDQGVYECGYYKFDKFGRMSYILKTTWNIQVLSMPQSIFNL